MRNVPAYLEIYNDLYLKIMKGEFADGEQLMTEMELCNKYFVSRITVQKALNLLVEKGLITRISGKGTFVNMFPKTENVERKEFVALVLSGFDVSFGLDLIKGAERYCSSCGYNLVLLDSHSDKQQEDRILKDLSSNSKISGIMLQSVPDEYFSNEILKLSIQKYPLVLLDRNLEGISLPFVGTDNKAICEKTVDKLIKLGHTEICFVSPDIKNNTSLKDRFEGLCNAQYRNNLIGRSEKHFMNIKSSINGTEESLEEDVCALIDHLNLHPEITCILSAEYAEFRVVMKALSRMKKRIPDDISVVTFDNVVDSVLGNNISYIKQNEIQIGQKAAEILIKSIVGISQNSKIYISADYIENNSVKALRPSFESR